MVFELVKSCHSVGESNYHISFCPKYRRDIFVDKYVKKMFFELCTQIARDKGLLLLAVNAGPDHVHLFVGNCRKYTVGTIVKYFKGITAKRMREHPVAGQIIRKKLWKDAVWSRGYFYRSIGSTTNQAMEYYVKYAQRKHWHITKETEYRAQKLIIEFVEKPAQQAG